MRLISKFPPIRASLLNSIGVVPVLGWSASRLASVMGDDSGCCRTLPGAVGAWGGLLSGTLYIASTLTLLVAVGKNVNVLQGVVQAVTGMAARVGVSWISVPFAATSKTATIANAGRPGLAVAPASPSSPVWIPTIPSMARQSSNPRYATTLCSPDCAGNSLHSHHGVEFLAVKGGKLFKTAFGLAVVLQLVPFV